LVDRIAVHAAPAIGGVKVGLRVGDAKLRADDQLQRLAPRGQMRTHHTGE
jgi:hypothetical protein